MTKETSAAELRERIAICLARIVPNKFIRERNTAYWTCVEELEVITRWKNPPLVATPEMAKVISVRLGKPGQVLEMKIDNRYKDGRIRLVKGVVRGNKNTVSLEPLSAPRHP